MEKKGKEDGKTRGWIRRKEEKSYFVEGKRNLTLAIAKTQSL